jgi:hypothetical protein
MASNEPRLRIVDRVVLHEGPLEFARLAERVITDRTRYLVLDLDRTVHLGRNMGELLGWELGALHAYGAGELERMEPGRGTGRLICDVRRPLGSLRYLLHGARTWAVPGLYYLAFGKIPARSDRLRAWTFRRFGAEPVRTVQRVPQNALMALLASVPEPTLRVLAERVWDRHGPDEVIRREDLDALRARFPALRVIITSASPRVVVEVARDRLGADEIESSEPGRINSGPAKIVHLEARFPEVLDPEVESVGITDTGYGEDHCWSEHFTRVVDVNSDAPFSPIVSARSPVRELHSAHLVTNRERQLRDLGVMDWMDPRRPLPPREEPRVIARGELNDRLREIHAELEALSAEPAANAWPIARLLRDARHRIEREAVERAPIGLPRLEPA